jgi:hypothetical protein
MAAGTKWCIHVEKSGTVYVPYVFANNNVPSTGSAWGVDQPIVTNADYTTSANTNISDAGSFRTALYAGVKTILDKISSGY